MPTIESCLSLVFGVVSLGAIGTASHHSGRLLRQESSHVLRLFAMGWPTSLAWILAAIALGDGHERQWPILLCISAAGGGATGVLRRRRMIPIAAVRYTVWCLAVGTVCWLAVGLVGGGLERPPSGTWVVTYSALCIWALAASILWCAASKFDADTIVWTITFAWMLIAASFPLLGAAVAKLVGGGWASPTHFVASLGILSLQAGITGGVLQGNRDDGMQLARMTGKALIAMALVTELWIIWIDGTAWSLWVWFVLYVLSVATTACAVWATWAAGKRIGDERRGDPLHLD